MLVVLMPSRSDAHPDRLAVSVRDIGVGVVLHVRGDLSLRTVPQLRRTLDKNLADRGRVLVDLSELTVSWWPALEVFPAALASMTGWPAARLVLFGAGGGRLLGAARRLSASVHLAVGEAEAVELLEVRPRRLSRRTELACEPQAAKWSRMLVDSACADWQVVDAAVDAARLVVSELVTNSVLHAGTSMVVTLTLTEGALRVGVRDLDPRGGPELIAAGKDGPRSSGMAVVAAMSRTWGVRMHDDGKTVWASIPCGGGSPGPAGP
jgi:anti-sigma regulatory factor (Ser/Thr protein kinase)